MIFNRGDIVVSKQDDYRLVLGYTTKEIKIIGRVLEYDLETDKLILDVYVTSKNNANIHTGKFEVRGSKFEKASNELTNQFISYIKRNAQDQDKIYIDFVNSFSRANEQTKYKIVEYILTAKINNENE